MAAEPRSPELPDGPRTAAGRATERSTRDEDRIAYCCGACGKRFVPAEPGPAPCPRCQSVGDHDALGRIGGVADDR
jgi:uncharacterized OB-fold protein